MIDQVWLKILYAQHVNICEEMGYALMRTSYSPIFSEGLDFSAMILDRNGQLVSAAILNGAMLGQSLYSGRWVIDEIGPDNFEPGDVVIHNDPYRGGSHMPEHLLVSPVFYKGELRCFVGSIGHLAEIGGMAPGSFASNATEIYQEGLRLPPVKIFSGGEPVKDVWRIILANHRTPETSWGDLHALVGVLRTGAQADRGASTTSTAWTRSRRRSRPCSTTRRRGSGARSRRCRTARTPPRTARRTTASRPEPVVIRVDVTVEGDGLDRRLRPQRPAGARSDQRAVRGDRVGRLQRLPLPVRHRRAAQRRLGAARRRAGARGDAGQRAPPGALRRAARPSCSRACWS